MNARMPRKVNESAKVTDLRLIAVTLNQVIDQLTAQNLRESPNTRIERSSGGTYVHVRKSSTTTEGGSARWL